MQLSDLDLTQTYSYADYLKWHLDERIELIKGKIFKMSPAPGTIHQKVSGKVYLELGIYLKGKPCLVFSAPFDVRLPRKSTEDTTIYTVVQPDICVICDSTKIDDRGCVGAPDIVVEILSPGNNQKELKNKFEAYEEAFVKEYWIIHPTEQTFLKYVLSNDNKFQAERPLTVGDLVRTPLLPDFELILEEVFENL